MNSSSTDFSHLIPEVVEIAREAGRLILDIYKNHDYQEFTKSKHKKITKRT